jgi:hypothetical protein
MSFYRLIPVLSFIFQFQESNAVFKILVLPVKTGRADQSGYFLSIGHEKVLPIPGGIGKYSENRHLCSSPPGCCVPVF